ncbi:MAG TPA: ribosome small subunit-dependent GTPase A [Firmicutes bacterium]|nr:ribosome small subunit-dependent GTPase A [Bacillota bacterium]
MPEGRVIQGVGGFYEVMDLHSGQTIAAVARGKFKRMGSLYVGDLVRYEMVTADQGVIEEVFPRRIELLRPTVSNIDRIMIVFALKNPDYNLFLIDRFLLFAETTGLEILLVFNKRDLVGEAAVKKVAGPYREIGYKVIITSTKTRQGKRLLLQEIKEGVTVLSGPSGVGKSAIMNMVCPSITRETGEVSKKIGRGRHTTRQAKLLSLPNKAGFLVDTPGFTQLDLDFIEPLELAGFFPDFRPYFSACRFPGCLHKKEPDCSVKDAVSKGQILSWRYEHYLTFLEEAERFKRLRTEQKYRGRKKELKQDERSRSWGLRT